ncbi:fumarylacetoacetate hydrolase [Colletotrichum tabaci]|uniref:Fumarylacetoacetate hydrolase n=1 Tax=Colletotrichum tabaci TaxID=1209068 RepID=A0AAV9TQB8_9PEZI
MTSYLEGPANFVAYLQRDVSRIGHLDLARQTIQPLSFDSGTPVENLYQVIEASAAQYVAAGSVVSVSDVKLLPPISGRDVLAVGKNYMEHAKEFNSSGYDSSDKVDRPSHPVIFTKRATSIIAHGDEIHLHQGFTESADYEGEIGVIIGKAGYRISEEDAWDYVWGFTIINDLTARERQRDHKQFYIGKSPDTFCPMGPIAVAKENLPDQGRSLRLQTHVNGQLRQDATLNDLIFSIPRLIATLSAGQTLQPGDVLATGTPAGVGLGLSPPTYLKSGDEIAISVTGLGTLKNTVAESSKENLTTKLTISHLAAELKSIFDRADASPQSPATLVAHSLGCLIAINFASEYPDLVKKLVLFGPPPSPLPNLTPDVWFNIAEHARSHGMSGIVDGIVSSQVSDYTKINNPLAVAAVRLSLLGQDPEAYAKACSALALGDSADFSQLNIETLLVTGQYDPVSSPSVVEDYAKRNAHSRLVVLPNVGHWHVFEDVVGVGQSLQNFL